MEISYSIGLAEPEHLDHLPEIERQAAGMFRGWNVPDYVIEEITPPEDFRDAQDAGLLWVALSPQGQPVGFALTELEGDIIHLEELDVHPLHGRRGIGGALVEAACEWARNQGLVAMTLTTYRDIPWNGPFYARLGFQALDAAELTPHLLERVKIEAARGLEPPLRVVMRKTL